MYSYVSFWSIPRPQWADMDKATVADQKILDKAMADGAIVGYGSDLNLVHDADGITHDDWWSGMSMAAILNVLDKFYKSGTPTSPVLASATKHSDGIFVSHYYNWRPGSYKGAYTRVAYYKLKAGCARSRHRDHQPASDRANSGEAAGRRRDCRIRNRYGSHPYQRSRRFLG